MANIFAIPVAEVILISGELQPITTSDIMKRRNIRLMIEHIPFFGATGHE
jgi:hypothetical protein